MINYKSTTKKEVKIPFCAMCATSKKENWQFYENLIYHFLFLLTQVMK